MQIVGHSEAIFKGACPPQLSLNGPGRQGWKAALLALVAFESDLCQRLAAIIKRADLMLRPARVEGLFDET